MNLIKQDTLIKVDPSSIINSNLTRHIESLECPIDNTIPVQNGVICSKCQNVFCEDCLQTWQTQKPNQCPLRCQNIIKVKIHETVLKPAIEKIMISCKFVENGCKVGFNVRDFKTHVKTCNFRDSVCQFCSESMVDCYLPQHVVTSCSKTKIKCEHCDQAMASNDFVNHIGQCLIAQTNSLTKGSLIENCPVCKLPELKSKLAAETHECDSKPEMQRLHLYFRDLFDSLAIKFKEQEKKLNNWTNHIGPKFEEMFEKMMTFLYRKNLENQNLIADKKTKRKFQLEKKISKVSQEKKELINQIAEMETLLEHFDMEEKRFEANFSNNLKTFETLLMMEKEDQKYRKDFAAKCMKNAIDQPTSETDVLPKLDICSGCSKTSNELKQCNKHKVEICSECTEAQCDSCGQNESICCMNRCFYEHCLNKICTKCYSKIKHQYRNKEKSCNFTTCGNCQSKNLCLITTKYCGKCSLRVCKKCESQYHTHQ